MVSRVAYVYLSYYRLEDAYKVGKAFDPKQRGGKGLIHIIECPNAEEAFRLETFFHCYFWLKCREGVESELFDLTEDDIRWFTGFSRSEDVPRVLPEGAISPKSIYHPRNAARLNAASEPRQFGLKKRIDGN